MTEAECYARAGRIIQIAMGQDKVGRTRGQKAVWRAEEDPLAYWLGVEAIMALVDTAAMPHDIIERGTAE